MSSPVVKSVYQNDFRRFVLPELTLKSLTEKLLQSYDNLKPGFSVKYADDEGDICVIGSDVELREAFNVAIVQKMPLKIFVESDHKRSESKLDLVSEQTPEQPKVEQPKVEPKVEQPKNQLKKNLKSNNQKPNLQNIHLQQQRLNLHKAMIYLI